MWEIHCTRPAGNQSCAGLPFPDRQFFDFRLPGGLVIRTTSLEMPGVSFNLVVTSLMYAFFFIQA